MKDETLPPFDASALGELLVDLTPAGTSPHGSALFERNAGGAPANVLAFLAKLGLKTAFLGKVGNDPCGRFLLHVLREAGIDLSGLRTSRTAPTTLALVELGEGGERSFSFYRNPGADSELSPTELDLSVISRSQVFHFGSVSLTLEPSRSATFAALEHARQGGKTISFDPNLRPLLWKSLSEAKKAILSALPERAAVPHRRERSGARDARTTRQMGNPVRARHAGGDGLPLPAGRRGREGGRLPGTRLCRYHGSGRCLPRWHPLWDARQRDLSPFSPTKRETTWNGPLRVRGSGTNHDSARSHCGAPHPCPDRGAGGLARTK